MKKAKLLRKQKTSKLESLVFANTLKRRIPIAPPGFSFKSSKAMKNKNIRITKDNWEKLF